MRGAQKVAPWTAIVGKRSPVGKRNPFRLSEKKLRGPYSNRHQTHLAFCRDYSAVHGAIFNLKRKGFRFPTRLFAICKAVDRVTFFTSGILSASPLSLTPLRETTRAATLVAALAVRGGALSQRAVALWPYLNAFGEQMVLKNALSVNGVAFESAVGTMIFSGVVVAWTPFWTASVSTEPTSPAALMP